VIHAVNRGHSGNNRTKSNLPGLLRPVRRVLAVGLPVPVGRICQRLWSRCLHAPVTDGGSVVFRSGEPRSRYLSQAAPRGNNSTKGVSDKVMYLVRDAAALYLVTTRDTKQWPSAPVQGIRGDPVDGGSVR
jgi:hypothetical protein